jgi:glutamine cyclotransferase
VTTVKGGRSRWLLLLLLVSGCDRPASNQDFSVIRTLPHDPRAYTQGLVFHDGFFFESTGRYGESSVRKVDPESGEILAIKTLPDELFGEGLALVGRELYQLTWKSGVAIVYDADSLTQARTYSYTGEGWGLCFDGESLYMSNGSDRLTRRDPGTFEPLEEIQVLKDGFSVWRLNELECVGNDIFANVYQTNRIVRIDKRSGHVMSEVDGYRLSVASKRPPDAEAVFNGIAHDPETGHFYVTGKLWPDLFEIQLLGG